MKKIFKMLCVLSFVLIISPGKVSADGFSFNYNGMGVDIYSNNYGYHPPQNYGYYRQPFITYYPPLYYPTYRYPGWGNNQNYRQYGEWNYLHHHHHDKHHHDYDDD